MPAKDSGAQCIVNFPATSSGVWMTGNPLRATLPLLMIQITLIVSISRVLQHLLRPLKQPAFISQILAGVLLGPTALGKLDFFNKMLYPDTRMTPFKTFGMVSVCMYMFVIGVKTDVGMLRHAGKKAIAIGLIGNAVCYVVTALAKYYFPIPPPKPLTMGLGLIVSIPATFHPSYFVVVTTLLSELRLLNSKVGRLAVSSALISDLAGELMLRIIKSILIGKFTGSSLRGIGGFVSFCILIVLAIFAARPVVLSILARTPKGELLDETYFISVIILCLSFGFLSELSGQTMEVGMLMLGLILPSGPPLGSTVTMKLEGIINSLGIPIFFASAGLNSSLFSLNDITSAAYLWLLILVCYFSKFFSVLITTLCCRTSLNNATIVALMMSAKGIFEIRCLNIWLNTRTATQQEYSVITSFLIIQGMVTSPLIKTLYRPREMYRTEHRLTIQHSKRSTELRVLTCMHAQQHVMSIIKILGAIHHTNKESMCVYVLHMIENTGQAAAILAPYRNRKSSSSSSIDGPNKLSEPIMNAFRLFERQNPEYTLVQPFVSVAPSNTMHDDVCYLSLEKKVVLVLLPFHRRKAIDGTQDVSSGERSMNVNVLAYAPCSVAILISATVLDDTAKPQNTAAVFFLGGADDREGVSIAMRMTGNPGFRVTVVRYLLPDDWHSNDPMESKLDDEVLVDFRSNYVTADHRVCYREEQISDVEVTLEKIRSMCEEFSLLIVGRREGIESPLNDGLALLSEQPELGVIGDILASPDFSRSVSTLVVQQQRMSSDHNAEGQFESQSGPQPAEQNDKVLDP